LLTRLSPPDRPRSIRISNMDIFTITTPPRSVSPRQELVKDVRVADRVRSPYQMPKRIGVIVAGILYFLLAGYVFATNSSGAREYMDNCARCHGADAKGNGVEFPDQRQRIQRRERGRRYAQDQRSARLARIDPRKLARRAELRNSAMQIAAGSSENGASALSLR